MDPLFVPEPANRVRVILNTDAKNEADDQYAIVHAILTPLFELHGIIPAHFGDRRGPGSLQASHEEVLKLLDLMDLKGHIPVHPGAATMLPDEKTPVPSEGSALIIKEALKEDPRPFMSLFSALSLTWLRRSWKTRPSLSATCGSSGSAARIGLSAVGNTTSGMISLRPMWSSDQKSNCGKSPARSTNEWPSATLNWSRKFTIKGPLASTWWINWWNGTNNYHTRGPIEHRSLGDSPAVGVMMYPECGWSDWRPAPEFNAQMNYVHTGQNRPIRFYHAIDQRFILEDFFAKLARWHRKMV